MNYPSRGHNNQWLSAGPNRSLSMMAVAICAAIGLAGCGGGAKSGPAISPIAFTDANGVTAPAVTSFKVGAGTYMDATITSDDEALGVNWSVSCGSALPPGSPLPPGQTTDQSCGTFTAVHTVTAPVPSYATSGAGIVTYFQAPNAVPSTGTVTVYASATSSPSVYTSATFTIIGVPIGIGFAPAPPASLTVSGTAAIGALVSNDSANGGVNWTVTCGSMACGSFSAAETPSVTKTTYTAPDAVPMGGFVTITATSVTDPTKSVSAAVTIVDTTTTQVRPWSSPAVYMPAMYLASLKENVNDSQQ